ncbi:hypothetical protein [Priestia megaterium]|uniref:hypothetical protein n=1 Tax=Priestia megaterium TaxID=1404 RepID=UPI000BFB7BBE|nr:hypothetical protein [Priestia megaterium]PGO60588.1 hypothetical protein CN981_08550 [Priestia megaterium]
MRSNIFIPTKINVGFVERSDTYTNKLAYIIYFDEKGKLRKEGSWNSWRDHDIDNVIEENVPTSGFVLNKKAGGYSSGWNHRQTYVRVYDPRGFEFEISVPNLLYILENTNSIKGKGLEGEFVYGWDGKDLVLMPVSSPDYIEITKLNELIHANNFVKAKELKVGATYLTKKGEEYVYMGKFDEYGWSGEKKEKQAFYFYDRAYGRFERMKTVARKFVSTVSEECAVDYADIFEELEGETCYSPIDRSKDELIPLTKEEFENYFSRWLWHDVNDLNGRKYRMRKVEDGSYYYTYDNPNYVAPTYSYYHSRRSNSNNEPRTLNATFKDTDDVMQKLKPVRRRVYLANGKVYSEDY